MHKKDAYFKFCIKEPQRRLGVNTYRPHADSERFYKKD